MAEEVKKTKKKFGAVKGEKRKKYPVMTKEEVLDCVQSLMEGENVDIQKRYKTSVSTANKIRSELKKPRKPKGENDKLPECYFLPRTISQKVDCVLFDLGYVKIS